MLASLTALLLSLTTLPVAQVVAVAPRAARPGGPLASAPPAVTTPGAAETATGTLVFGGDVLPHRSMVASFRAHGPGSMLGPVAPVFRAADLALVNVDSPASPSSPCPAPDVRFNIDTPMVRALADAGIDGIVVANNHAHDYGVVGLTETVDSLHAAGIRPLGVAPAGGDAFAPETFPMAGRTLCVFAVARLVNWPVDGSPEMRTHIALVRERVPAEMTALLRAMHAHRARCDGVLVSFHGGTEYHSGPDPAERNFARAVAEAGADVVIGHHSHTPQPIEVISTRRGANVPVFYSLGNLVSGQGSQADLGIDPFREPRWQRPFDPRVREGLIAVVRFAATPRGRLRVASYGALPVWTLNTTVRPEQNNASPAPSDTVPRITATLMPLPSEVQTGSLLWRRYHALARLLGTRNLARRAEVPGVLSADQLSREARVVPGRTREGVRVGLLETIGTPRESSPNNAPP